MDVFDLAADDADAFFAEGVDDGRDVARGARGRPVGEGLQRVAGEDRVGLAEPLPDRRTSAPELVVVHRRQVVVDERVVVEELDRGGREPRVLGRPADGDGRGEADERTDPLAARADGVAHGLGEDGGAFRRGRQDVVERPLDEREEVLFRLRFVHGLHSPFMRKLGPKGPGESRG